MRPITCAAVLILALGLSAGWTQNAARAEDPAVKLASLDWPPFSGETLDGQGTNTKLVKAAFKSVGYSVSVEFFPWSRTVYMARHNPAFIGYFPEYHAASVAGNFIFSESIGKSPIGFVERVSAPVVWNTLDDLRGLTIGTVQDYVNTEEFDRMAAAGELKVELAKNDLTNVRKVLGGRIPLAVIDKNVLDYLLATVPDLTAKRSALQFNKKQLEDKDLYVCFRKGQEGEKMVKIFNEGLKKIKAEKIGQGESARPVQP
jgi:polar amino acid transport system substrate-binding protein